MTKTVIIIGGGLVGSFLSLLLAKRGYHVTVFERREDIRKSAVVLDRSINLALSERGLSALKFLGIDAEVKAMGIPMYARMIHSVKGEQSSQAYGIYGENIRSLDRNNLNEKLLTEAEKNPNIKLFFGCEVTDVNLDQKIVSIKNLEGKLSEARADLIVGADGAFSFTRGVLMKKVSMNYQQEYIEHGYKQIRLPPNENGSFKLDKNHLHVWPRGEFMLIAIPNIDGSFTCTLFMPLSKFENVKTVNTLLGFFRIYFPNALPLIGESLLVEEFFKNPTPKLMSIKCKPYHYKGNVLIVGDAAHAMVPFYGEGMNTGFEDCMVLNDLIDRYPNSFERALEEYSKVRHQDVVTICDLSMENYAEMRDKVNSPLFTFKRSVERFFYRLNKDFIPIHNMISHTTIPYSECVKRAEKQEIYLNMVVFAGAATILAGIVSLTMNLW
jgi:kynurenine 3-monooxygenase